MAKVTMPINEPMADAIGLKAPTIRSPAMMNSAPPRK